MLTKPMSELPGLSRVIEKQMRNWELGRAQRPDVFVTSQQDFAPFVTIANVCGAGGNEVAHMLAERLGWPVFDREILTLMARDDDVRESLYRSVDLFMPKDKGLRVKVVASMERCVENFVRFSNVSPEQARREIDRIERERREFVENHFHIDPFLGDHLAGLQRRSST